MRRLIAVGVILTALAPSSVCAYDLPFARFENTFWQPVEGAPSYVPANLAIWFGKYTIEVRTPCGGFGLAFQGPQNSFKFSNEFKNSQTIDCKFGQALERRLQTATSLIAERGEANFVDETGASVLALKAIIPTGIEYRILKIVSYRAGNTLIRARWMGNEPPTAVFFNREIDGSPGCGGFIGTYNNSGSSGYRATLSWALAGSCYHIDDATHQNDLITNALSGPRTITPFANGCFLITDANSRPQAKLCEHSVSAASTP